MELEQLKEKWTSLKNPGYSREELESIYNLKQGNVLNQLASALRLDLVIALGLAFGFIILLQKLNLQSSNFWSIVMGFVALQHLVMYLLQVFLIRKLSQFSGDVSRSINLSINRLEKLQWSYRTVPLILTLALILVYHSLFGINLPLTELIVLTVIVMIAVLALSEYLSAKLLRMRIKELQTMARDFRSLT